MLSRDSEYFHQLQTDTGWNRTLLSFADWCSPTPGWLILDVGCGPGLLPAIFARLGCRSIGVDSDPAMFAPAPLHPIVAVADIYDLPFSPGSFDMITASNLVFMLEKPIVALNHMKMMLRLGGKLAMLNPTESLTELSAIEFASQKGLDGLARDSLVNWARRATAHYHWTESETRQLYSNSGLTFVESATKVGPGFARFSSGKA